MTWFEPHGRLCRPCAEQTGQAVLSAAERRRVSGADVVVLGAGAFGAFIAEQLVLGTGAHVAVIDAGDWISSGNVHSSNCRFDGGPLALADAAKQMYAGAADGVRVVPWRSNACFPGIVRAVGGRSIFWAGWSPTMRPSEHSAWPRGTRQDLRRHSRTVHKLAGVRTHPAMRGPLQREVMTKLTSWAAGLPASTRVAPAPLAVTFRHARGEFEKFSSVAILRTALEARPHRLTVLTGTRIRRLALCENRIVGIETCGGSVELGRGSAIVLALGTIESTRLVLASVDGEEAHRHQVGHHLMSHLRTDLYARLMLNSPAPNEGAAALVRGRIGDRHWHLQVTATVLDDRPSGDQARHVADLGCLDPASVYDPRLVHLIVRAFGEQLPATGNFVELHPEVDECGVARAAVHLQPTSDDLHFWDRIDQVALGALRALSTDTRTEYLHEDGAWSTDPPIPARSRRDLGSSHHEGGTLRAGDNGTPSDAAGRLRLATNAFVVGPALFPRLGSAGPVLPGLALARAIALRLGTCGEACR